MKVLNVLTIITLLFLLAIVFLTGCSSAPRIDPVQQRRDRILSCVKDLKQTESSMLDSFEVCRQVYQLSKVQ